MASWASATPVGAWLVCLVIVIWAILGVPVPLTGPLPSPGRPWQRILIALSAVLCALLIHQTVSTSSGSKPAASERDVGGDGRRSDGPDTIGSRDRLESEPTVTVFDMDECVTDGDCDAVLADVYVVTNGKRTFLGETSANGVLRPSSWCAEGDRFVIEPRGDYREKEVNCSGPFDVDVGVRREDRAQNLEWFVWFLAEKGRNRELALVLNELGATTGLRRYFRQAAEVAAEEWPVSFAGPALELGRISQPFRAAIASYQVENRLPANGRLDYDTLESLAQTAAGPFIHDRDGLRP